MVGSARRFCAEAEPAKGSFGANIDRRRRAKASTIEVVRTELSVGVVLSAIGKLSVMILDERSGIETRR